MVKIRLQRRGRKKKPYYHIVAADSRSPRDGRIIEDLGRYNPLIQPNVVRLDTDRVIYWLNTGAQPSDTVRNLLKSEGVYYRMHLQRWGKSQDEIDQTISDWKTGKTGNGELTIAEKKKAALEAEEKQFKKEQEELAKKEAEAKAKKEAEEKAKAEAAEKEAKEAEAAAAEEAKAEKAEESAEEVKAAEESVETAEASEEPAVKEEKAPETKSEAEEKDAEEGEKEEK